MFFTTLVSAGLTALALSDTAAASVLRSVDVCKSGPQTAYSALSRNSAAQTYCSSAFAASTVTTYITTTSTAGALATTGVANLTTITVTELSTLSPTPSTVPVKAKRGKCRKPSASRSAPIYSANSTAYSIPHSTGYFVAQSTSVANEHDLFSSLISGPSTAAEAACSCYIGTPVTVTATSTAVISNVATAAAQVSGTVTVTTVVTVTGASSTASENTSSSTPATTVVTVTGASSTASENTSSSTPVTTSTSTSTSTSTTSSSSAAATTTCASETTQYQATNGDVWEITSNSLYGADDSNLLDHAEQPDLDSCVEACAAYSGCQYAFWVADETYGATHQCYYLSNDQVDYGTGFCGIDTIKLVAE